MNAFCFSCCYAAALGLGILRLASPARWLRAAIASLAALGLVAHTLYLGIRAVGADASPLSSPYDWYLLAAWLLAGVCLAAALYETRITAALLLMPLVLGLIVASQFADREPFSAGRASRLWGNLHGSFLLLGTVSVTVGFVAGIMYLVQSYRLKRKRPPSAALPLPSLERLERINARLLAISAPLIGIGFLAGVILNRVRPAGEPAAVPWYDPVVLSSAAMLVWLLVAELFRCSYRSARRGHKVAYLTVTSFAFLTIALATLLFVETAHGPSRAASGSAPPAPELSIEGVAP